VATFGSFDGVHLGHELLLRNVRETANRRGLRTAALILRPHPSETLGLAKKQYLSSLQDIRDRIEEAGIDLVSPMSLPKRVATGSQGLFLAALRSRLPIDRLVISNSTRIGRGPEGSASAFAEISKKAGLPCDLISTEGYVQSANLAHLVASGAIEEANRILGRPYALPVVLRRVPRPTALRIAVSPAKLLVPAPDFYEGSFEGPLQQPTTVLAYPNGYGAIAVLPLEPINYDDEFQPGELRFQRKMKRDVERTC